MSTRLPPQILEYLLLLIDTRLLLPGTRLLLPGTRLLLPGTRLLLPGTRLLLPGTRLLLSGTRLLSLRAGASTNAKRMRGLFLQCPVHVILCPYRLKQTLLHSSLQMVKPFQFLY